MGHGINYSGCFIFKNIIIKNIIIKNIIIKEKPVASESKPRRTSFLAVTGLIFLRTTSQNTFQFHRYVSRYMDSLIGVLL